MYAQANYREPLCLASRRSEPTAVLVYKPSLRGWPRSSASTILRVHPRRSSRRCLHWRKRASWRLFFFFSSRPQTAKPDSVQYARPPSSLRWSTSIKVTSSLGGASLKLNTARSLTLGKHQQFLRTLLSWSWSLSSNCSRPVVCNSLQMKKKKMYLELWLFRGK